MCGDTKILKTSIEERLFKKVKMSYKIRHILGLAIEWIIGIAVFITGYTLYILTTVISKYTLSYIDTYTNVAIFVVWIVPCVPLVMRYIPIKNRFSKNSMFFVWPTILGNYVSQLGKPLNDKCALEEGLEFLDKLEQGIYYTQTHPLVINRLKKNSRVEIIEERISECKILRMEKFSIRLRKSCKKCSEHKKAICPALKNTNEIVQMYDVKFRVNKK